ncbi:MAG TPA: ATP phosphoribosyltransferase regulatory subunit, partial [Stellaceae bacterium]|nr:ATP phosphoribosyltransferase regulatory subunit [Stellaceae bacterium]
GAAEIAADVEVVALAAAALAALGIDGVSVDLTLPRLVPMLIDALGFTPDRAEALKEALDHKDAATVARLGGANAALFERLLASAGPAEAALVALAGLKLPPAAAAECRRLEAVVASLTEAGAPLGLTIDAVENRGFEYHTGISFTFFARGSRGELGRGGRYRADAGEPATGFTLYTDTILQVAPAPAAERRLYVPADTPHAAARGAREAGYVTVAGLAPIADIVAEARRLHCGYVLSGGEIRSL